MSDLYNQELLSSIRNEMTHLWGAIFATSGGVIALILGELNILKVFFVIFGTLLSLVMINAYFIRRTEAMNILKSIKNTSQKEFSEA